MTPDELELAKEGIKEAVKQTLAPVQDIVRQVSGPAATEVGLMLGDYLRFWRIKFAVGFLEKVGQVATKAGLKLKPVAPRLLFPILDAATLNDEEDLQQRWVALLINAAKGDDSDIDVLPAFPDILKQLTSTEAQFLDKAYDESVNDAERRRVEILAANPDFKGDTGILGISGTLLRTIQPILVDNMERLKLVTRTNVPLSFDDKISHTFPSGNHLYMTDLGKAFVRACRLPKPTK